ncbi:MAG: hypothetical protein A2261_00245 [Candidatus Magasanikbacteria bacterium RIFOXYA2_FULL_44_8]|uniref:Rod shape-determining protein MreD n=1 Tax=Candidatus Magasanikbacteria bacterium RIFOXYA2_FULL_44_8 TaxID=1798696 RepID=A0A1F6NLD2_9BACT|nr:MAG: hypothetical protein A2261_00245 [Candidatus Magasanikbacteria bacterium RIFOXYA2_FULL_44_8]
MKKLLPIYLLLILAVASRFLPHPANFTAIGAIAMFGGLYLPRRYAVVGPLVAMFVSDIFLGFYHPVTMASVYLGFIIMTGIGLAVRQDKKITTVLGGTILGSVIFFLITNLSVWIFGGMYAQNLSGLVQCYYMAIPFFKNTLAGDLTYVTILVGGYELATHTANQYRLSHQ